MKNGRQHKPAGEEGHGEQQQDTPERLDQRQEGGILQIGLHGEKQNNGDILQHQNAQGDAAGEGFQLPLVIKNFDNDDRAAHGGSHGKIERSQRILRRADKKKNQPAQRGATGDLDQGGPRQHPARAQHFFQVNFQPDHEQHKRQADFRDGFDIMDIGDPLEAAGADCEPGHQIGQQDGQSQ